MALLPRLSRRDKDDKARDRTFLPFPTPQNPPPMGWIAWHRTDLTSYKLNAYQIKEACLPGGGDVRLGRQLQEVNPWQEFWGSPMNARHCGEDAEVHGSGLHRGHASQTWSI